MTLRKIVKKAREKGIKITYKARKDGSIFVKTINGKKYKGVTGNKVLRAITDERLSIKRILQRQENAKKFVKSLEQFSTKNLFKKAQKEWRLMAKVNKDGSISKLTWKGFQTNLKIYGESKAREMLWTDIKYSKGIAREDFIDWIQERLSTNSSGIENSKLQSRIDFVNEYLEKNKSEFKNDTAQDIQDLIYDFENGKLSEENFVKKLELIISRI